MNNFARNTATALAHKIALNGRAPLLLLVALLLPALLAGVCYGQSSALDGRTPTGLAPGSPAGSYALSGFDNVNLFNGRLNFRLPLLKVGGRGSAGYTMMLPIEQKWIIKTGETLPSGVTPMTPNPNWWEGARPGYGPGVLQGRRAVYELDRRYESYGNGESQILAEVYLRTLTRLTFTTADGTEYELLDKLTGGEPHEDSWYPNTGDHEGFSRGTVFKTADGTSATFISDIAIKDRVALQLTQAQRFVIPSGYLLLRDGTRYRIDDGSVSWIRDSQGNQVTFGGGAFVTDSLGRAVTITPANTFPGYEQINFTGYNGAARTIRVYYDTLENRLRPNSGYSLKTPYQLFPLNSADSQTQYNTSKVASVVLPNNDSYQFYYNPYGELARVVLPTGGAIEYEWGGGAYEADGVIFRYVTERRVYSDGGTVPESRTGYTREATGGASPIVVQTFARDSSILLSQSKHYFYGDAFQSISGASATQGAVSYSPWQEGREYKTETFDIASGAPVLVQRVEQTWQQPTAGQTWPLAQAETSAFAKPNNPQITRVVRTLTDNNLISVQSFGYDQYNNQTDSYESANGVGVEPSLPWRHTHTDYLSVNPQNQIDYTDATHILGLPTAQTVYEINPSNGQPTQLARTETLYDEAAYAPVIYGAITGWSSPGTTARGQATTTRRWLNTTGGYLETHALYDQAGNVVKTWDGRGQSWETSYADNYSDQIARGTYAYPTQSISPLPDTGYSSSTTPLITTASYDYSTGLVTKTIDANNQQTTITYNDPSERPTRVERPDGGYTTYEYGRNAWGDVVHAQTLLNSATGLLSDSYSYTDGLGRPSRSFQFENSDPSKPWLTNDTQYDAMGRVWRTANTYRSSGPATSINPSELWTTRQYDGLGRVTAVMTPDGAAVTTSYLGNSVTVTDQAGKKRTSHTDGLGRLAAVVEDPGGATSLNYVTEYTYDALDNLRVVKQGDQRRYFMYDSLSRLIRARNPEQNINTNLSLADSYSGLEESTTNSQWSMAYSYDANGNLLSRTDARGVTAAYDYDNLNRQIRVVYSDGTSTVRYYDGATNGRGRLNYSVTFVNSSLPETANLILSYDSMGRPLQARQRYWGTGAWGATYDTQRTYDVAGHTLTQSYPSGHTVSYSYDVMGRTATFTGNLGDGVTRTYMAALAFDNEGRMTREQFGTDIPLYNKRHYNVRGQLYDIRLSSVNDDGNWNRGAVVNYYSLANYGFGTSGTDNNGNLRIQQQFIPRDDSISASDFYQQNYDYDALNRLAWAGLYDNGTNTAFQQYSYDRYGNRTISQDSWGGVNEMPFTVDAATNRLGVPGGLAGAMQYDANGNLTNDTYTGTGTRSYDAENRIVSAANNSGGQSTYAYNGDGQRVKRETGGQTTYQVYGIDGELVAEYAANGSAATPQKEYGYRNGELLITASPGAQTASASRTNFALASNGGVATASSTTPDDSIPGMEFHPSSVNDGNRSGSTYPHNAFWRDNTADIYPDWVEVAFNGTKLINEIDVFALQDAIESGPSEPTESQTFSLFGITAFDVQYWNGTDWVNVPGGSVTGNTKVWRKFTFAAVMTSKVRVLVYNALFNQSRVVELEAYGEQAQTNFALSAQGATATASSTTQNDPNLYPGYNFLPAVAIDGDRKSGWNFWRDDTAEFPDWLEVNFGTTRQITEIDVFTLQDDEQHTSEPTPEMSFSLYGIRDFRVEYWTGSTWVTCGEATANTKVWRKFTFPAVTTSKIRVYVTSGEATRSRIVEVEAYGASAQQSSSSIEWIVTDQLGTPRMIADRSGSLSGIRRHDYLPFGEELTAVSGGRTIQQGYVADAVRQKFTSYERDNETGLDFAQARYYSPILGRFTSPDEFTGGPDELYDFVDDAADNPTFYADISNPQSLNKYQYVYNNPLRYTDPTGHCTDAANCAKEAIDVLGPAAPIIPFIPGVREVVTGVLVTTAVAGIISAIPGDNTQGDGSCPSCDAYINRARASAQKDADRQNIRNQDNSGNQSNNSRQQEPQPVSKKEAVKEAHRQVGKQTERGKGKFGSPMRGNSKKGYRLDPPNPNGRGLEKTNRHVNWWDYTKGKKGKGGRKGYIPIKES